MALIRAFWRECGVSNSAVETLTCRWTKETRELYCRAFARFLQWRKSTAQDISPSEVVNYLEEQRGKGRHVRTVLSLASGITAFPKAMGRWRDDGGLLATFTKAVKKRHPVRDRRADPIPSIDPLLEWLRASRDPSNRKVSRMRAVILCRFVTLARSADISFWLANSVVVEPERILVRAERTKRNFQSRSYYIPRYTGDEALCPYTAFLDYWRLLQGRSDASSVWRGITPPFDNLSVDSIRRISREALQAAGIDLDRLKAHGLRMVSTSQALIRGAAPEDVMTAGGWKSVQTMYDFYVRRPEAGERVGRLLFSLFDEADQQTGDT